ncbi:hypothetical protein H0H81_009219, partial [Sphagnurus paluster]
LAVYKQAIYKLVSKSYLKPSTVLSHISPRDKRIQYEAEEKAKIVGFPTAREIRDAKEVAAARLKREEEEAEQVGLKRKSKAPVAYRTSKKKAVEEDDHVVEDTLIVRAAKERYNDGAALVVQAALKVTESAQMSVSEVRSGVP